mgnify:CR=1 FL=1
MAKKTKKGNKGNLQEVQTVEQVFAPVGMVWNPGVSEETKKNALDLTPKAGIDWDEVYLGAEVEENKSNGGSKEAEVAVEVKAEVIEAEIPVGGFNRNGMDAMLTGNIGPEVVVNVAQEVTKKSTRLKLSGGYRGTVREMLLAGEGGEAIIKKIASMYQEKGMSYEYGFDRGKRILGDMALELKKGVYGTEVSVIL